MSYLKVKKQMEAGQFKPVYFLYGTQAFLMEELTRLLRKSSGNSDSAVITYSLQETLLDAVIEDLETVSFFGNNKLVIVKDFVLPTSQKVDEKLNHDIHKLEKYIENPNRAATLVLICPFEKLDARNKITKALMKHTEVIECSPFDDKTMNRWLDVQAKENGFDMTEDAKELIQSRIGPHLLLLSAEMEKLGLYVGEGGRVDSEIVNQLVSRTLEQDVFSLIDLSIDDKLDKALVTYHDLMKQNEEPLKILALIARQLRIYYQVKELSKRSYSQKQIAGQLKLHPYVVKLAQDKMSRIHESKLFPLIEEVTRTDFAIKSGKMDKTLAVELLLMKLKEIRQ